MKIITGITMEYNKHHNASTATVATHAGSVPAIVLETGRSERCRWEPLALVV